MRTPIREDGSPTSDDSTLCTTNHLSDVFLASFQLTTTASYAFFKSTTVASYRSESTFAPGSQIDLSQIDTAALTADTRRLMPEPLKKPRLVKPGERTNFCTQAIDVSTSRRFKVTPPKLTVNAGNYVKVNVSPLKSTSSLLSSSK